MKPVERLRVWGILASALVMGCDAQVSPRFIGEALLTITGSVQIEQPENGELVVPALAFWIPSKGEVRIQDVQVQGEFPSAFRLDIFEPPPTEAYFEATRQGSGEPRMAAGYITAVAADHPSTIQTAIQQTESVFGCLPAQCGEACGGKGCLVSISEYCPGEGVSIPCYSEATYCPTFESSEDECIVEPMGDGDPALKESPWASFAGFSKNYLVVFLEQPARAASATARLLGASEEVPAGYGLYGVSAPTEAQAADNQDCTARAEVEAASGFNEEFGTELSTLNFEVVCAPQDFGSPAGEYVAPFCGGQADELEFASDARDRYIERAKVELGCALLDAVVSRVRDPAKESVAVTIGPRLLPPFGLP